MQGKRTGIVVTPRTPYPKRKWYEDHTVGWVRSILYDFDSFDALYNEIPDFGTYIFGLINGEADGMGNDFWSDGWEVRWQNLVTQYCVKYGSKVRAIEFLNEWDTWSNANRVEVAVKCAVMGTAICRNYGILGFLGSVAGADWVNQFSQAVAMIAEQEVAAGTQLIDGVVIHPYGANSGGVPEYWSKSVSQAAAEMSQLSGGRLVACTEAGIKLADIGVDLEKQAEYVTNMFKNPDGEVYQLPPQEFLCACYFAWCDHAGNENEQGDNAFGLVDFDGNDRPAREAFEQVAFSAPTEELPQVGGEPEPVPTPEPTPTPTPEQPHIMTAVEAFEKLWQIHIPNAAFRPTWGIEKAWMQNYHVWGSPVMFEDEAPIEYAGASYNGRIFANAIVVWKDGSAVVLHDTGMP